MRHHDVTAFVRPVALVRDLGTVEQVASLGEVAVTRVWDVYLDADDASTLLHAARTLERHRWVREPLPFDDVARLLARLRLIAELAAEDAENWKLETEDRVEESRADGGRWGDRTSATAMAVTALALADGSREVREAASAAAADLATRIANRPALDAP
jgi:hypothetical protein